MGYYFCFCEINLGCDFKIRKKIWVAYKTDQHGLQLTVNEAAAQLCMRDVALLTRRDELFGLARQISREVTYKYTYRTSK